MTASVRLKVVEQILTCTRCELSAQCRAPVPFRGQPGAEIVLVGEAPGRTEDEVGRPFIGPAGQLLDRLLDEAGLQGEHGIVNTASCFPHGTPNAAQIEACEDNKWAQIDYLAPRYLLLLGGVALRSMRPELTIKRGRGRPFMHHGYICFATYHPAAALRNGIFESAIASDLEVFRDMIHAQDWTDYLGSTCGACPIEAEWYEEESQLGWCPVHIPFAHRPAYDAHQALLAAELDAARARSIQARNAGIAAVADAADPAWMEAAWTALLDYLKANPTFFTDDWWDAVALPRPRESRAFGPIVLRAAREGYIEKSGLYRKSVASNMTEKPVWISKLYEVNGRDG